MKTSTHQAFIAFDRDHGFRNLTDDSGPSPNSVTIKRNPRSRSNGIVGHVRPEIAVTMVRNTHPFLRSAAGSLRGKRRCALPGACGHHIWAYSWKHFVDHMYRAWYHILTRENRKYSDEKSPAGKTDYHTIGGCYEVLNVIRQRIAPSSAASAKAVEGGQKRMKKHGRNE